MNKNKKLVTYSSLAILYSYFNFCVSKVLNQITQKDYYMVFWFGLNGENMIYKIPRLINLKIYSLNKGFLDFKTLNYKVENNHE